MKKCEWCNLKEKDRKWLLFETASWSIYLSDIQDYIGRCILVLNRHCESLSELTISEWMELKDIIDRLEHCYTSILGADLCNWSCLMNDFYKKAEPNPHVHIHVRPRYKQPVIINNKAYVDTEYGHHYALNKTVQLGDEDRVMLYELMKRSLT